MEDVFEKMNSWSGKRIQELRSWKNHHETQIQKIDEEIKELSKYGDTYEEFINKIKKGFIK